MAAHRYTQTQDKALDSSPSRNRVILALLAVQVLFGLHYPIIKPAFDAGLDPGAWAVVRGVCATVIFLGSARWLRCTFPTTRRDLKGLAIAAVFGVVVNQISFVSGLSLTTPAYASVINITIPVTTLACTWLLGLETPNLTRGCGVAIAAVGLGLMLNGQLEPEWRIGNLLTLVNAVSFGYFLVISRPLYQRIDPYAGTAVLFFFGTLGTLLLLGWRLPMVDWFALPGWVWAAMAYVIVGATVGSYALTAFSLRHAESSLVAFFIFLQPIIATAVSALAGTERLDWRFFAATIFVGCGVVLVLRRPADMKSF